VAAPGQVRDLVIDALRPAWFKRHPGKEACLLFHSDRDSQYASHGFRRVPGECDPASILHTAQLSNFLLYVNRGKVSVALLVTLSGAWHAPGYRLTAQPGQRAFSHVSVEPLEHRLRYEAEVR
jgi:transposase InsO family protein